MSEIKFACPHCEQHLAGDLSLAGAQIQCPACQRHITVPPPTAELTLSNVPAVKGSPPSGSGVTEHQTAKRRLQPSGFAIVLVIAAVLVAIGIGSFLLLNSRQGSTQPNKPKTPVANSGMASQPDIRKTEEAGPTRNESPGPLNFQADPSGQASPRTATAAGNQEPRASLLDKNADPSAKDNLGRTPLHLAAEAGDKELMASLLEKNADPNARDNGGRTPLWPAAWNRTNAHELVQLLVSKGADPSARNNDGVSLLSEVAMIGHAAGLEALLANKANVNTKDAGGWTPLIWGLHHKEVVMLLLAYNADIHVRNGQGRTPLEEARRRGFKETVAVLENFVATGRAPKVSPLAGSAILNAIKSGDEAKVKALLNQYPGMIDYKGTDGSLPLHVAVETGNRTIIAWLLSQKAGVSAKNNRGLTPLHLAASGPTDATNLVELLLSHGADLEARDNEKAATLHAAVLKGHLGIVNLLLAKGANPNAPGAPFGFTPLHLAVSTGRKEIVERLLAGKADVNVRDQMVGLTPLHLAAGGGSGKPGDAPTAEVARSIAGLLIAHKGDVNARDGQQRTPLHLAAASRNGSKQTIELLLTNKAEIEAKDAEGATPLLYAVKSQNQTALEFLIERGANINAKDGTGRSALESALMEQHNSIAEILRKHGATGSVRPGDAVVASVRANDVEKLKSLLKDHPTLANAIENELYGQTVLHFAAIQGMKSVAAVLLENGADVHAEDRRGHQPLHLAALTFRDSKALAELLLARNAKINAKGELGATALHEAAKRPNQELLEFLVSKGADINAKDHDGKTALDRATQMGLKENEELLRRLGATVAPKLAAIPPQKRFPSDVVDKLSDAVKEGDAKKLHELFQTNPDWVNASVPDSDLGWSSLLHFAAGYGSKGVVEELLARGGDVSQQNQNKSTPLHKAVEAGHREVVALLLDHQAEINAKGWLGSTPLHVAAAKGQREVVELLVARKAEINILDDFTRTPLAVAMEENHQEIVALLRKNGGKGKPEPAFVGPYAAVEQFNFALNAGDAEKINTLLKTHPEFVRQTNELGMTPLHLAASLGRKHVVEVLIANRADVQFKSRIGLTPLQFAKSEAVAELLRKAGASGVSRPQAKDPAKEGAFFLQDVAKGEVANVREALKARPELIHSKDEYGRTALHLSAYSKRKEVAETLLAHGADIHARDAHNGRTPLDEAAAVGNRDVVEALMAAKAAMNVKGSGDWTPLHAAAQKGNPEVVRLLLRNKADVKAKDSRFGWTPLHTAAQGGNKETVELLLANGAEVNARDNSNWTPLHLAAERGHKEAIEALLASRAEVNARDRNGTTPLHQAASHGHKEAVELLLAKKADVNAKDFPGSTPLLEAIGKGDKGTVSALLAHNADVNVKSRQGKTPLKYAQDMGRKEIADLLRQKGAKE